MPTKPKPPIPEDLLASLPGKKVEAAEKPSAAKPHDHSGAHEKAAKAKKTCGPKSGAGAGPVRTRTCGRGK